MKKATNILPSHWYPSLLCHDLKCTGLRGHRKLGRSNGWQSITLKQNWCRGFKHWDFNWIGSCTYNPSDNYIISKSPQTTHDITWPEKNVIIDPNVKPQMFIHRSLQWIDYKQRNFHLAMGRLGMNAADYMSLNPKCTCSSPYVRLFFNKIVKVHISMYPVLVWANIFLK